jgi:hypothetical protein
MAFRVPKCLHLGGKSGVESEQISSEAIIFRSVWHLDSQWESFSADPIVEKILILSRDLAFVDC